MNSSTFQLLLLFILCCTLFTGTLCKFGLLDKHPCTRLCHQSINTTGMTCHYRLEIERYYTMSKACYNCPYDVKDCFRTDCIAGDGFERLLTVANRKMPGQGIQVCLGDTIVVDVVNLMAEESTTIHWHGFHQRDNPYMDGVPFLTQCPIAPGTTFAYRFLATQAGTHFYHSHTGCQRADGLYGSLVVRQPKQHEIHGHLYDYDLPEHVMIVTDWLHKTGADKFAYHYQGVGDNKPDTLLVNGMGRHREFKTRKGDIIYTPLAKFNVQQGKRYRFRVINAEVLYCPIEISVDNHTLIIINSDGGDIQPVFAESLVTYAGERWDFIINANNNVSNYWIKMKGLADCDHNYNSAHTLAVLHYKGAEQSTPNSIVKYKDIRVSSTGIQANPLNVPPESENFVTVAEMRSDTKRYDPSLKREPDISLFLPFDFYPIDNDMFAKAGLYGFKDVDPKFRRHIPQINHISMKMPSAPLLSEPQFVNSNTFCDLNKTDNCSSTFCFCTYKIDLPLNKVIEIIFVDEGVPYMSNHPMHLHGYSFRVVSLGKLGNFTTLNDVKQLNTSGQITRNLLNPPIKDVVTVPDGGYTVIRFYTSNPGYWILHCHLDFHVETGMAVVFKVGSQEDFPPVPENFPTCGDYFNQGSAVPYTEKEEPNGIWNKFENYFTSTSSIKHIEKLLFLLIFVKYCLIS